MDKRSGSLHNIYFALLLLLAACGAKPTEASPTSAILSDLSGDVNIQPRQDENYMTAIDGHVLNEGGQVKTGNDGRVRLDLSTGTIVRVGPSSFFKLISNATADDSLATKISLELGKIWIILNGGELDVETTSGQATVRGSYMGVSFKDGVIRLSCLEGTCAFKNETGDYVVPPGFVLECTGPNDVPTIKAMTEQDIQEWLAANPESAQIVAALQTALSATPTITPTPPVTFTPSPTATATFTATATQVASLPGEIQADLLSCRYGPGGQYLYIYGFSKGSAIEILGKAQTSEGLWVYIKNPDYEKPCWVNSRFLVVDGDVTQLEEIYPDKAPLILFNDPRFPPPTNVEAGRTGNFVGVTWVGYELALGDRESEESPRYLVEFWTCQGGQIVFTAYGAFEENALVKDEPGCNEPSHGNVYLAHKDGYIGPVPIPWPSP